MRPPQRGFVQVGFSSSIAQLTASAFIGPNLKALLPRLPVIRPLALAVREHSVCPRFSLFGGKVQGF